MADRIVVQRAPIRGNSEQAEFSDGTNRNTRFARAIIDVAEHRGYIAPEVLGHLFAVLTETTRDWSLKTFGTVEQRGPRGPLLHLEKEAREAVAAIGTDALAEELADCQILIWDAMYRAGMGPVELLSAVRDKLEKNMARSWPAPSPDMPVEHIREEQP